MDKVKLNFRYHNPNTDEETLKLVSKLFIEASRVKFENVLREAVTGEKTEQMDEEALRMV